jgi:hypothetical protein
VNLPNRFHYLNNTLPMGRHHSARQHRQPSHGCRSSTTSNHGSGEDNDNDPRHDIVASGLEEVTNPATQLCAGPRRQRSYASSPPSPHSSPSSSRHSDSSGSDADNGEGDDSEYPFHARLVKLDCRDSSRPAVGGGHAPLVAQCCDTVRGTIDLLSQLRLSTGDMEQGEKFFWLDLHGVPPPLPGTPEWRNRPPQWQRRQHAALRTAAHDNMGQAPEVELRALWTALGLHEQTVEFLTSLCRQRQLNPHHSRISLDDIYEEEMVDLNCPDDRILQMQPLSMAGDTSSTTCTELTAHRPKQREQQEAEQLASQQQQHQQQRRGSRTASGQPLTSHASLAARRGATHYVVMELATLLTCVSAPTASMSAGMWSSTHLANAGSYDFSNEPLNDAVWTRTTGRHMHTLPDNYRGAAAAARQGGARSGGRGRGSGREGRQLVPTSLYPTELPVTPLIASTYVICFPSGCVTWCPSSTLGLISTERHEKRQAAAQRRRRLRPQRPYANGDARPRTNQNDGKQRSDDSSDSSADSDFDEDLQIRYVKSWEQLQASVFHRLRHMAARKGAKAFSTPCATACAAGPPELSTSGFVSLLLSSICYAYLPNTASVLSEVDAIDSMLPLVGLNDESDQADALRRVLLLRRRLAVHRRLLFQKARLLEALNQPAMHTVARFVRTTQAPSWVTRAAAALTHANTHGTFISEGRRRESDTDSLPGAPTPHPCDHATATGLSADSASAAGLPKATSIVQLVGVPSDEVPWSSQTAEESYGDAATRNNNDNDSNNSGTNDDTGACFPACPSTDERIHPRHRNNNSSNSYAKQSKARVMAEPPSLNAIHKGVTNVLRNLETARTVLGMTTLIYSSTVNCNNSRSSEGSDYFALICQYVVLIVLPLNIVASQWGMNCAVPFMHVKGTKPFWSIVGIIIFIAIAGLTVPIYAYRTGKITMIA